MGKNELEGAGLVGDRDRDVEVEDGLDVAGSDLAEVGVWVGGVRILLANGNDQMRELELAGWAGLVGSLCACREVWMRGV